MAGSVKVLVLDFDGVLVNLEVDWVKIRHAVSDAIGYRIDSLNTFWEENWQKQIASTASEIVEKYELSALDSARPDPESLNAIRNWKGTLYIASMQPLSVLSGFVEKYSLSGSVSDVLDRIRFGSKRRQFEYMLRKEGVAPDAFLVIDDSSYAAKLCNEIGFGCITFDLKKGDELHKIMQRLTSIS